MPRKKSDRAAQQQSTTQVVVGPPKVEAAKSAPQKSKPKQAARPKPVPAAGGINDFERALVEVEVP